MTKERKDTVTVVSALAMLAFGCILVGENKVVGKVINSWATFKRIYPILKRAYNNGEKITLEIV